MTRLDALTSLRDKVRDGIATYECFSDFFADHSQAPAGKGYICPPLCAWNAFNGSLDAAKALHEAVLPYGYDQFETFSLSGEVVLKRIKPIDRFYGWSDMNPARAWLLAILEALIAQEGAKE